jgi:tRNA(fMet)-specific endonuclease VapC
VHRAQDPGVRARRAAFVESLLSTLPVLPVDLQTARAHARLLGELPNNETTCAHDALIAATALRHGCGVLTRNVKGFSKLAGVRVLAYTLPD